MEEQYRQGQKHTNADALSRFRNCEQCELKHEEPNKKRNVKLLQNKKDEIYCRRMVALGENIEQESDTDLAKIIKLLKNGRLQENNPNELKHENDVCKKLWNSRDKLRFRGGLLYYITENDNYRLIIRKDRRRRFINLFTNR